MRDPGIRRRVVNGPHAGRVGGRGASTPRLQTVGSFEKHVGTAFPVVPDPDPDPEIPVVRVVAQAPPPALVSLLEGPIAHGDVGATRHPR